MQQMNEKAVNKFRELEKKKSAQRNEQNEENGFRVETLERFQKQLSDHPTTK